MSNRPIQVHTPPRRLLVLVCMAAAVGVAGGGAAWVLVHLIAVLTNLALFHRWGWQLPSFRDLHPGPGLVVAAARGVVGMRAPT